MKTNTTALLLFIATVVAISCNRSSPVAYRDLNKNGKMDVYEDSTQSIENRVNDLIDQMTVEEKAGMMFISGTRVNDDGSLNDIPGNGPFARMPQANKLIQEKKITHMNIWIAPPPKFLATWYNNVQQAAENSRLGIPVTIASDPRHYFSNNIFAMAANGFSQWPEQLGFAAIGDEELIRRFGDIARQEYLAVGLRIALHPMADLATEPRWPRISGTFGEDAKLSARMVKAYILGFQGEQLGTQSVATMTKHFSGGGPQKEGLDSHFEFHKGQTYPGNNFNYHLIPFEAAFEAHTASIMPYYGIPTDQTSENVGFGFNRDIITKLLREKYKFDGVVCTDWGLITDVNMGKATWYARAWGVEKLTEKERVQKVIDAGCDQFGGEKCPELIVELMKEGKVSESRIDESVKRLLHQKFKLGLFDNPYVDATKADQVVGKPEWRQLGEETQRRSFTLLKNDKKTLPLTQGKLKLYIENINPEVAAKYGTVVKNSKEADIAIIRLMAPWIPFETANPLARQFHHGDLDFKGTKKDSIVQLLKTVPTIVDLYLDRPSVIPEISQYAKGLLINYGASDAALLDVIFGNAKPMGKLPFELPSSMEAVRNQKEDVPYDSKDPLYKFGFGLSYE
jgi:beta-glucosidase